MWGEVTGNVYAYIGEGWSREEGGKVAKGPGESTTCGFFFKGGETTQHAFLSFLSHFDKLVSAEKSKELSKAQGKIRPCVG